MAASFPGGTTARVGTLLLNTYQEELLLPCCTRTRATIPTSLVPVSSRTLSFRTCTWLSTAMSVPGVRPGRVGGGSDARIVAGLPREDSGHRP